MNPKNLGRSRCLERPKRRMFGFGFLCRSRGAPARLYSVMDDAEFSIGKLQQLKDLGVGFAIDDYGTGYSCRYYLKRLPVDSLKIDGSFVVSLGENPGDEAIVSGTIDLAHALGLRVVAEGVETAEQLAKLKELNCDMAQGFYLSEPLSAEEASDLLTDDHRQ